MFRLLFQYLGMETVDWKDSDNVEYLKELRETMLKYADNNNVRFVIEPMVLDISKEKDANGVTK